MGRASVVRAVAGIAASVGWAGLALQLVLIVGNLGPALGVWRFIGFFTILTNIGAAASATAVAVGGVAGLAGPRARLMVATSILMVGLVYSIALRALWNPTGLQKVADIALHAYVHCGADAGVDPAEWPAVREWLARVERTPGFVNDLAPIPEHAYVGSG